MKKIFSSILIFIGILVVALIVAKSITSSSDVVINSDQDHVLVIGK